MPTSIYRATHRVDTTGLPPLYCMRERDAIRSAEERLPALSSLYLHMRDARTGAETWDFWRTVP